MGNGTELDAATIALFVIDLQIFILICTDEAHLLVDFRVLLWKEFLSLRRKMLNKTIVQSSIARNISVSTTHLKLNYACVDLTRSLRLLNLLNQMTKVTFNHC